MEGEGEREKGAAATVGNMCVYWYTCVTPHVHPPTKSGDGPWPEEKA